MTELTVQLSKTIHATIEKVFDAWLDPQTLSAFMLPMPGMRRPEVETDATLGGRFSIHMHVGDEIIPHTGEYLEISRPNRLVFSWESPFSTNGSTVSLNFSSLADNETRVDLLHQRFPDEESRSDHEGGWVHILDKLDEIEL